MSLCRVSPAKGRAAGGPGRGQGSHAVVLLQNASQRPARVLQHSLLPDTAPKPSSLSLPLKHLNYPHKSPENKGFTQLHISGLLAFIC